MKILLSLVLAACGCGPASRAATSAEVDEPAPLTFDAPDGKKVFAELFPAPQKSKAPLLILFHQAGSNLGEYRPLIPSWTSAGFNCLAVSLRSGGAMWNEPNQTAAQFRKDPGYLAAYLDMQASVVWALKQGYPRIGVVGSSYSASLAFHLAEDQPEISMVAAFSPGEYGEMDGSVAAWVRKVRCPIFVACSETEHDDTMILYKNAHPPEALAKQNRFIMFAPGAHGVSAMRIDRNKESADKYQAEFLKFLSAWQRNWK